MAILCREARLLFIRNPRTGSTALARLLREKYGGEGVPVIEKFGGPWYHRHASLKQVLASGVIAPDAVGDYLKFSTVRNPFDSIASYYQKRVDAGRSGEDIEPLKKTNPRIYEEIVFARDHGFDEFVERYITRDNRPHLRMGGEGLDHVLRFERLNEDFAEMMHRHGRPVLGSIPQYNATVGKRHYTDYYSDWSRSRIEEVYGRVMKRRGYGFGD